MPKYSVVINSDEIRDTMTHVYSLVSSGIRKYGKVVLTLDKQDSRSLAQNRKLWPMLTDFSKQLDWHGQKLSPDDWKHIFTAAIKNQKCYPGIDGGLVFCGYSTSNMDKKTFSELIEFMFAFGAENQIQWSDPETIAAYSSYWEMQTNGK